MTKTNTYKNFSLDKKRFIIGFVSMGFLKL